MTISDIKGIYTNNIEKLNYALILCAAFFVSFPTQIAKNFWVVWLISWLLEARFLKKSNFTFKRSYTPLFIMTAFLIWQFISLLWAADVQSGMRSIERQLSLAALPLIACCGVNKNYNTTKIIKVFVLGCVVSSILYLTIIYTIQNIDFFYNHGDKNLIQKFSPLTFTTYSSLLKHRLYHCTILCIAIFSTTFIYKDTFQRYGKLRGSLLITATILLLLAIIIFTGSRASIITLTAMCSLGLWLIIQSKYKTIISLAIILCLGIGMTFIFKYHPRMKNISFDDLNILTTGKGNPNAEPRLYIWHEVISNADQFSLYGLGAGNSTKFLTEKYIQDNYGIHFLDRKYATHNQYFSFWMELGIISAILLMLTFILYFIFYTKRARIFAIFFSLIYGVNMMTEGMLGRIDGIIIFSLFALIIVWIQNEDDRCKLQQSIN